MEVPIVDLGTEQPLRIKNGFEICLHSDQTKGGSPFQYPLQT